jgi:hypothetical protein
VRFEVIGPVIAHNVLPPRVPSLEINEEEGHVPVSKLLAEVAAALEELAGAARGASSPGEAISVSPPEPQETRTKIERTSNKYLVDFRCIRFPL